VIEGPVEVQPYRTFRFRVTLARSWATPWHSDIIFGHLCWGKRYLDGDRALTDWLGRCHDGKPPLVLSDGMPKDMLPRPLVPVTVPPDGPDRGSTLESQRQVARLAKQSGKGRFLHRSGLAEACLGRPGMSSRSTSPHVSHQLKNQINRATSTTAGPDEPGQEGRGALFQVEEYQWSGVAGSPGDLFRRTVDIYARIARDCVDDTLQLFDWLREHGYGRRRSVGLGAIESIDVQPDDELDTLGGMTGTVRPTGFVSLSHFVPAVTDPMSGQWRSIVKYGKVSEANGTTSSVFKFPIVFLQPGACFVVETGAVRPWYGRMVTNVHPTQSAIVQCGIAFALPIVAPSLLEPDPA